MVSVAADPAIPPVVGVPLTDLLEDPEKAKVMDTGCLADVSLSLATIPHDQLFTHDPRTTEPARSVAIENSPGYARTSAPILLVQGDADPVVVPARTEALRQRLCGLNETVGEVIVPGGHQTWFPDYL